jgi:hypothetical protein
MPALLQTHHHWRIECNRTGGTPMRVDAISIPAAGQAASTAARPPSSASSSFSAAVASSMHSSAPEHHQGQFAAAGTTAKSDSKVGAAPGAKVGPSLNAKPAAKSNNKSDAKPAINSSTAPETQPLPITYPLSASLLGTLLTTSLATFLSTSPTASPTTSPTLTNIAAAPPPPSSAQPGALIGGQIVISPAFALSGTLNASSPQDDSGSTATSAVPLAVTSRTGALPASNAPAQFSTPSASPTAASSASPVPTPAGSQFHAPIPAGVTILALDQSQIVQSPSVPAAPFTPVRDINLALVTAPANGKQPAAPKVGDSKAGNSAPGDLTAPEPTPTSGSATLDTAPGYALSSDATATALAQNIASNSVSSLESNSAPNSAPNSAAPASTAASIAATAGDAPSNGKPGVSAQPTPAAASQTTAAGEKSDKKSSAAVQPNTTASHATPVHDVSTTLASGKDSSATMTAPAPPASAPPPQGGPNAAPELPKTHQMLDSAPPAPPPPPIAADLAAAAQTNAQMHVGIRTEAFGAVEIHSVVQQSQVGLTVRADRDIAHWFSAEIPGLESGLNKNHLNLTAVDFDSGGSGVQTATSFQQGQPQQHFSERPGSQSAALPDGDTASKSSAADILPSDLYVGPAKTHVSIHV